MALRVRGLHGASVASGADPGYRTGLGTVSDHSTAALNVSDRCGNNKGASSNTVPVRRSFLYTY